MELDPREAAWDGKWQGARGKWQGASTCRPCASSRRRRQCHYFRTGGISFCCSLEFSALTAGYTSQDFASFESMITCSDVRRRKLSCLLAPLVSRSP